MTNVEIREPTLRFHIVIVLRLVSSLQAGSVVKGFPVRVAGDKGKAAGKAPFEAEYHGAVIGVDIRRPRELIAAGLRVVAASEVWQIRDSLILQSAARELVPLRACIAR